MALHDRGVTLGQLGRYPEAIAAYDDVIRLFHDATEPKIRDQAAKAQHNKGVTLDWLNQSRN